MIDPKALQELVDQEAEENRKYVLADALEDIYESEESSSSSSEDGAGFDRRAVVVHEVNLDATRS